MFVLCPQKRMFSALLLLPLTPKRKTQNAGQQQSSPQRICVSVKRCSKLPGKVFIYELAFVQFRDTLIYVLTTLDIEWSNVV